MFLSYNVSTSKYGAGIINNSNMTPVGLHKIRNKIGEGTKGTQIKTGSICNNDGIKKSTIIDYIHSIIENNISSRDKKILIVNDAHHNMFDKNADQELIFENISDFILSHLDIKSK